VTPPFGSDQPLRAGAPTRLTYNPLPDSQASWLPDGSLLLYTAVRADQPDNAACLEFLPPAGGRSTRSICAPTPPGPDSVRALEAAAASPSGRLVFVRSARGAQAAGWTARELIATSLDGLAPWRLLTRLPSAGAIPPHTGASQVGWLDGDRFVYRAEDYHLVPPCRECNLVPVSTGMFVVLVDLRADSAAFAVVPGTSGVSGVAAAGSDAILFSLAGDSRVYREVLSSGAVAVFWDFGAGNAVDEIQVAGTRLVAMVSGVPRLVDVTAGTNALLDGLSYQGLALTADGQHLVSVRGGDLWLFDLP
jgi:hypothetical protein